MSETTPGIHDGAAPEIPPYPYERHHGRWTRRDIRGGWMMWKGGPYRAPARVILGSRLILPLTLKIWIAGVIDGLGPDGRGEERQRWYRRPCRWSKIYRMGYALGYGTTPAGKAAREASAR